MKFTGSKYDLARACAYPVRGDVHVAPSEPTAASTGGTAEHAAIESTILGDDDPDAERSRTHARWISEWWEHERAAAPWQSELAIALDPRTGETRLLPRREGAHRDYSEVPDGMIPMTLDGVAVTTDDRGPLLRVADWKTGQGEAYKARTLVVGADGRMVARTVGWRRPREIGQLMLGGAAVSRHYRIPRVSLELVLVNDVRLWVERAEVSVLDLRLFEAEAAEILSRARGDAQPTPGPWCSALHCPLLGHCSATALALRQTVPAIGLARWQFATHSGDFEGPEHVGAQLAAIEAAEKRLDAGKLAVRMYLKERGAAVLPDGSRVAMESRTNERININAPGALAALKAALPDAWERAVETVTITRSSKERIYEAAKPGVLAAKAAAKAAGDEVRHLTYAAAQRRVVEALARVDGAVKRSEYEVPVLVPPTAPAVFPESGKAAMCSWCGVEHLGGPERCEGGA